MGSLSNDSMNLIQVIIIYYERYSFRIEICGLKFARLFVCHMVVHGKASATSALIPGLRFMQIPFGTFSANIYIDITPLSGRSC